MSDFPKRPSVDVVIPVFNGERTLLRAIKSIIFQRADCDIGIFVVDDFSSDNSMNLLDGLNNSPIQIKVIKNKRNLGNAYSRNVGIKLSKADYIAFLDQDDIWVAEKLALQLEAFTENHKLQYVVGMQEFILDDPNHIPSWFNPKWLGKPSPGYLPSALLAKRNTFLTLGLFQENLKLASDTAWFAKARKLQVPHRHLPNTIVQRGIHDKNLSSNPKSSSDLLFTISQHLKAKE